LECCKGSLDKNSAVTPASRVIVIDDPISSLSHNYVYDIASIIQYKIIEGKFNQIFILTHNLFFFHELIKLARREKDRALSKDYHLHRVTKNKYTDIRKMQESDLLNDYQSYWMVLKDCLDGKIAGVVLPNMMRNILEYYFNFVHQQKNLQSVLKMLGEEEAEFKALYRYINRQSHSDGVNINDFGAINPIQYIEKFKLIFKRTGFEDHFEKMMGTGTPQPA
jgi:wobble nucleotide-excising tRNase